MIWDNLLSDMRLGQEDRSRGMKDGKRTGFQVDFDRIIFSPAFRRLQSKTQVCPLPTSDFVRNRLTHSLETASVGRSLGNLAGEKILEKYPDLEHDYNFSDFGALVSAASLAHDIGNPPFGHAGEEAISLFFRSESATKYTKGLSDTQRTDLQQFEGNAAGFRILTHTPDALSTIPGGLSLCYSTYATFVKYPKASYPNLRHTGIQPLKKYNFFDAEKKVFERIASELDIEKYRLDGYEYYDRFPLAFLVEASDDICYTVIDYEDGFQMRLIPFEEIEDAFLKIIGKDLLSTERYNQLTSKDARIAYLRSKVINTLVGEAAAVFITHEEEILHGTFREALLDHVPQAKILKQF